MKTISQLESQFISQFQTMIQAFQINHGVQFQTVNLIANSDGTIGYDIVLLQQETPTEPEQTP